MFVSSPGVSVVKALGLVKVVERSRVQVIVQSEAAELLVTHWFGRQYVCPGLDCPACGTYQSRLSVWNVVLMRGGDSLQPRLLELSAQSWARLKFMAGWEDSESLSGLVVDLHRGSMRRPVIAEPAGGRGEVVPLLSSGVRLLEALAVVFKLPLPGREEASPAYCSRVRPLVVRRLEAAMGREG